MVLKERADEMAYLVPFFQVEPDLAEREMRTAALLEPREVALARPHSFGRYRVDLATIDEVGVPALLEAVAQGQVIVVDEIGPMEILSPRFQEAILRLLDGDAPVVGTVVQRPQPFADRVKAHRRVRVRTITLQNRNEMPGQLLSELALDGMP
jgi:nucleoside-triphosphatase